MPRKKQVPMKRWDGWVEFICRVPVEGIEATTEKEAELLAKQSVRDKDMAMHRVWNDSEMSEVQGEESE